MSFNMDPRGVARGSCSCGKCDLYEMKEGKFPSCGYCGCPPSEHIIIEVTSAHNSNSVNLESSTDSDLIISKKAPSNISLPLTEGALSQAASCSTSSFQQTSSKTTTSQPISSKANTFKASSSNAPYSQACFSQEALSEAHSSQRQLKNLPSKSISEITSMEKYVPNKFEDCVMKALKTGKLERNHKNSMIRDIGRKMLRNKETSVRKRVSVSLIAEKKYPLLGTSSSIEKKLHTHFKNQNRRKNQKSKDVNESTNNSLMDDLDSMQKEMGAGTINKNKLKVLLNRTRNERNKDASELNAHQLMQKYRALLDDELFLWEFTQIVDINGQKLRDNWNDSISKLNSIMPSTAEINSDPVLNLLLNLPLLFKRFGNKQQRSILKLFPDQATLEELVPKKNEAPFLTGIGCNPKDLMCYVDSHSVFTAKPKEAVLRLMAAYWIFKVAFEKELRQQLVLISVAIFGKRSKEVLTNNDLTLINVLNIIEEANINF